VHSAWFGLDFHHDFCRNQGLRYTAQHVGLHGPQHQQVQ
jgi:hypothetical protein